MSVKFAANAGVDDRMTFRAAALLCSLLAGIALVGVLSHVFPAGDDSFHIS